ncbi:MAG: hypothetical protein LQ346_002976 [Caloplaca aetnensis]|nr:MAG: hypothetical protein LQ346_002976 [Caloplaca aetnensis]
MDIAPRLATAYTATKYRSERCITASTLSYPGVCPSMIFLTLFLPPARADQGVFHTASEPLSQHRIVIFHRLIRFYDNFLLLSALTGGLSVGALQFSEFHPCTTAVDKAAEGLLTSSACSAVIAVMLAVMLNFRFEDSASPTRLDYGVAWTPLVLLDWSIFAVLFGLLCWYWGQSKGWRAALMIGSVGLVLCYGVWVAWWMWSHLQPKAGAELQDWQFEKKKRKRHLGGVDDVV